MMPLLKWSKSLHNDLVAWIGKDWQEPGMLDDYHFAKFLFNYHIEDDGRFPIDRLDIVSLLKMEHHRFSDNSIEDLKWDIEFYAHIWVKVISYLRSPTSHKLQSDEKLKYWLSLMDETYHLDSPFSSPLQNRPSQSPQSQEF